MIFSYMFVFSEYEGVRIASYSRYNGTVYFAFCILIIYLFVNYIISKLGSSKHEIWIVLVLLVTTIFIFKENIDITAKIINKKSEQFFVSKQEELKNIVQEIKKESNDKAKTYYIDQNTNGASYNYFSYLDLKTPRVPFSSWTISPVKKESIYGIVYKKGAFGKMLEKRGFTYLIINNSEEFWETYKEEVFKSNLKGVFQVGKGRLK